MDIFLLAFFAFLQYSFAISSEQAYVEVQDRRQGGSRANFPGNRNNGISINSRILKSIVVVTQGALVGLR